VRDVVDREGYVPHSRLLSDPWRHSGRLGASIRSLTPRLQLALDLAPRVAIGHGAPLVAQLLALGERDLRLHAAVLEVEPRRDEREALLTHLPVEPVDLAAVQEELARPVGLVVRPVAVPVLGDVQA